MDFQKDRDHRSRQGGAFQLYNERLLHKNLGKGLGNVNQYKQVYRNILRLCDILGLHNLEQIFWFLIFILVPLRFH